MGWSTAGTSPGVGTWLAARSQAWRDAVDVIAIDPSAAFRKALRRHLSAKAVGVDAFHLVTLANDMVTVMRQWMTREQEDRLGRLEEPAWANQQMLLRAGDTLSPRALTRLKATLRADDPPTRSVSPGCERATPHVADRALTGPGARAEDVARPARVTANMPGTDPL
jgi:hypothetical protein